MSYLDELYWSEATRRDHEHALGRPDSEFPEELVEEEREDRERTNRYYDYDEGCWPRVPARPSELEEAA